MSTTTRIDNVDHPAHYTQYEHEVIELTSQFDFCTGNAIKYILRAPYKGKFIEDARKALWYLKYLREHTDNASLNPVQTEEGVPAADVRELAGTFKNPVVNDIVKAVVEYCVGNSSEEEFTDALDGIIVLVEFLLGIQSYIDSHETDDEQVKEIAEMPEFKHSYYRTTKTVSGGPDEVRSFLAAWLED